MEDSSIDVAMKKLGEEGYGIVGNHSAVKICLWTKHALRGNEGCWKEKFYGISSAGCCQMTPSLFHCENKCLHCWRNLDYTSNKKILNCDDPKEILDGVVEARKKLLMGFKGRKGIDLKKFEEALVPKLYTMSLSGEPTLYPLLGEMFKKIRRRGAVSFLVTNGLNSEVIAGFKEEELPTQITVSTNAPNEKLFDVWHRSTKKNAWKEFNKTLEVIRNLKGRVRRVIRLTLVEAGNEGEFGGITNMTEENVEEYCDLIRKAEPDFIHVKGFKSVGYARSRMGYDNQPWFKEVKEYAEKIKEGLSSKDDSGEPDGYEIKGEDERSCVVMLAREGCELRIVKV
ncbi:radical SAM protein [Candidatus Pacearchaeota archaeon]|nr:radical SAM protein [Candidatus Pacearchaeota archaeon]